MADSCIWCDLDGRADCPVHYRRDPRLIIIVLVLALLVALAVLGAVR